jgi:hypothetical protein
MFNFCYVNITYSSSFVSRFLGVKWTWINLFVNSILIGKHIGWIATLFLDKELYKLKEYLPKGRCVCESQLDKVLSYYYAAAI